MRFIITTLIIYFLLSSNLQAAYKCVDSEGGVSFQSMPCQGESTSEKLNINKSNQGAPVRPNSENKRQFKLYTTYVNQKVNLDACVTRGSKYASEFSDAYKRFYEIGESQLEEGKRIYSSGFVGFSASDIRVKQNESAAKRKFELSKMSSKSFDSMCLRQAAGLRQLAATFKNRSSGYTEGDLDPEGND